MRQGCLAFILAIFPLQLMLGQSPSPCVSANVSILSTEPTVAGGGQIAYSYTLTNRSSLPCTLPTYAFPTALDEHNRPLAQVQFRHSLFAVGETKASGKSVTISPGDHAWFQILATDGTGLENTALCSVVKHIRIALSKGGPWIKEPLPFSTCTDAEISGFFPGSPK